MTFFTCGLLTCFEIVVYRKTAAFTVRGFPGVRGPGAVGGGQGQAR